MRPVEKIKKLFIKSDVTVSSELDDRIMTAAFQAFEKSEKTKTAKLWPNIWRTIMDKTKIRKVRIAFVVAVIMILFLGFVPLNGTTAFGKITHEVKSTLSRLKAAIMGESSSEEEYPSSKKRPVDKSVKIYTTAMVYSSSEVSSLEDFLNEQNIHFASADSDSAKYAVIPANKFDAVKKFLHSSSMNMVLCPKVLAYSGQEAMLFTPKTMGVAITVHKEDDDKHLNLAFAFHTVEDGCEVDGIKLAKGEALLLSGIRTSLDELMTILVLPELVQE